MHRGWLAAVLWAGAACGQVAPESPAEAALRGTLREAEADFEKLDYTRAEAGFRKALETAVSLKHAGGEGGARQGLGKILNARSSFGEARKQLLLALEIQRDRTRDAVAVARVMNDLGYTEWGSGNEAASRKYYEESLAGFEAAGVWSERPKLLYNLAFVTPLAGGARARKFQVAIQAAVEAGDARLEGKGRHALGDAYLGSGNLREALGNLEKAHELLARPEDRGDRARVLLSLGRFYALHKRLEPARDHFERALAVQRELGDRQGTVYALNNLSDTERELRSYARAKVLAEESVALARESKSASLLSGAPGVLGRAELDSGQSHAARGRLEESLKVFPDRIGTRQNHLSVSLRRAGAMDEAFAAAAKAAEIAEKNGSLPQLAASQVNRAYALAGAGRDLEAVPWIRLALGSYEKLRTQAGPTDFLKRGFSEGWSGFFDFAVGVFFRVGLKEEALEAAEKGRARAFLDLLATRSLSDRVDNARTEGPGMSSGEEPHLASAAAAPAATAEAIRKASAALAEPVAAYWVGQDAAYVWVMREGRLAASARIEAGAARIGELVQSASRFSGGGPNVLVSSLRSRGDHVFSNGGKARDPWRELHRLLVEPVEGEWKGRAGAAVVVVPHGPLHRLSFAGLRRADGRYLLEDYAIGYAPAIVLPPRAQAGGGQGALLVADPREMPAGQDGRRLPPLPGARAESRAVAARLKGAKVRLLSGTEAAEDAVIRNLTGQKVVHFATHGVLNDERPFDSFLALAVNPRAKGDGRLSVREIYDLHLAADLVVLSACQSADGVLTGDGILGMTRAFFSAGARQMVATLWDVADEPARRLVSGFYAHYTAGRSSQEALRAAQLELLAALRKKQVKAPTPLGTVTIPEHPLFWAAYVSMGRL